MRPSGRNSIVALMIQAPGARPQLDWSFVTGNPQLKVFGELGEQWVAMEGVVTSGPKTGTQGGNHYDYSAIEESTVSTVGNTADAPTKGLQINVILKSGGDQFHGNGAFFGTNHHLEGDNVNDQLRARGITGGNPVNARWDASGELGGLPDRGDFAVELAHQQAIDEAGLVGELEIGGAGGDAARQ